MYHRKDFDVVGVTILAGGLVLAIANMDDEACQQKTAESQVSSKTAVLNKLKMERDSLGAVVKEYKDTRDYSIEQRAIYQKGYKTYDDMDVVQKIIYNHE